PLPIFAGGRVEAHAPVAAIRADTGLQADVGTAGRQLGVCGKPESLHAFEVASGALDLTGRGHGGRSQCECRQREDAQGSHPTLPSRLTSSSFLASTANSIGSSRNTCLQKPSTIRLTASSSPSPRLRQ